MTLTPFLPSRRIRRDTWADLSQRSLPVIILYTTRFEKTNVTRGPDKLAVSNETRCAARRRVVEIFISSRAPPAQSHAF